jgi:hypothetical protein
MIQNATAGKRFFGKHFWPGVAEYHEGEHVTRVYLNEDTIRRMNPSFEGKPVFVQHVDEVISKPLDELKQEADGWVIRSFYNEVDGDTWAEFIVVSQRGLDAIRKGWRLSNAYIRKNTIPQRGLWNGVPYDEEITDGEFEHLAIVSSPRYQQSVILTPEEFKSYNEQKKAELSRLQNSADKHQEKSMPFNFFKKAKLENGLDLDGLTVQLPNTKREVALVDLIKEADVEMKEIKDQIILVNEEKDERMTIEEAVKEIKFLRNKCNELEEEKKKENEEDKKEEDKKENEEDKKEENKCNEEDKKDEAKCNEDEEKKDNEDDKDKKENEEDKKEDKKENEETVEEVKEKTEEKVEKNFLNELLNAQQICDGQVAEENILLPSDREALGRKYY